MRNGEIIKQQGTASERQPIINSDVIYDLLHIWRTTYAVAFERVTSNNTRKFSTYRR